MSKRLPQAEVDAIYIHQLRRKIESLEALCKRLAVVCEQNVGVLRTWAEHCKLLGVHCLTTDKVIKDSEAALAEAAKLKESEAKP